MISGLAIVVPVLVTLFVFQFAVGLLLDSVGPLADLLQQFAQVNDQVAANIAAVTVLLAAVFAIGFVAESSRASGRMEAAFDSMMSSIPGFGAVYSSFNEMSQLLLDKDTQSFQEVKLVEYPVEGSYCVAFVTAQTSEDIREVTGNPEMTTLYLPLAPNPVMGGYVIHIAEEKVYDVDMTVEEGMRSIVTSGIAVNEGRDGGLPTEKLPQGAEGAQPAGKIPDNDGRSQ
jgi:uncharacterized membrane protein